MSSLNPSPTLYRETTCEHGKIKPHEAPPHPEAHLALDVWCPGGSREKVTINYEAAVELAENHRPGVGPVTDRKHVKAIVNAALGE